jgi:hypothetical protein
MRKLVLAALVVFALGASARAALVLHVEDAVGSPGGQVEIDLWLEETEGDNFTVNAYSVGVQLLPRTTVTVQSHDVFTDHHPRLFINDNDLTDLTGSPLTYNASYDRFINDDAAAVAVDNATRNGLFRITYSIGAAATAGVFTLNIDPVLTEIADGTTGNPIPYTIDNRSSTVSGPEPSAMALGLFALPLLIRRRGR